MFQPSVKNLLAGEKGSLVLEEQFLVDVFDVGVVIRSPKGVLICKNKVDSWRDAAGFFSGPNIGMVPLTPIRSGVERTCFDFSNIPDFIHFCDQTGPVGDAGRQPKAIDFGGIGFPVDDLIAGFWTVGSVG